MILKLIIGFLILLFCASLTFNVFAYILLNRALIVRESYDTFFTQLQNKLKETLEKMHQIDIRGSFDADDEVGSVFKALHGLVYALGSFIFEEEDYGRETEEEEKNN